jgi:Lar family restriction alleviation protein
MPTELKPCPFCGGEAELVKAFPLDGQTHYEVAKVRCSMCKCQTDDYILNGYYGSTDTVQDAFEAWNKRFPPKRSRADIIRKHAELIETRRKLFAKKEKK